MKHTIPDGIYELLDGLSSCCDDNLFPVRRNNQGFSIVLYVF